MEAILGKPGVYSVVAEANGRIVGSNFLWEDVIAGVGPITISPDAQNSEIGGSLMRDVLDHSRQKAFSGVRLVQAAFHNRSLALYTKLGFAVREPLAVVQGTALRETMPGYEVRTAVEQDVDACDSLCARVHGHTRTRELRDAVQRGIASVVVRRGNVKAYATLIGFFGHAVAENERGPASDDCSLSGVCRSRFPAANTQHGTLSLVPE